MNLYDEEKREGKKTACSVQKVEKSYKTNSRILGPVSLNVYEGEILGLRGANGAGKSTLLKIMSGVITPDIGSCMWSKSAKENLAYVPQDIALYMTLSGMENLEFWGAVHGLPRSVLKTRSRWLLEKMGLSEKAEMPVNSYSGGMCRRLHFASGLVASPKLLLLDEPTVGADAQSADIILSMLKPIKDTGCAIVLVTHQQGELEKVCDRIITLEKGCIAEEVKI